PPDQFAHDDRVHAEGRQHREKRDEADRIIQESIPGRPELPGDIDSDQKTEDEAAPLFRQHPERIRPVAADSPVSGNTVKLLSEFFQHVPNSILFRESPALTYPPGNGVSRKPP